MASTIFKSDDVAFPWLRDVIGDTTILDLLPLAVYICEAREGTIRYYNEQAVSLWGRRPGPGDTQALLCGSTPMAEVLETGIPVTNQEVIIQRPDGSRIVALVNINPLRDDSNRIVGAVGVLRDITELKRTEELPYRLAAIVQSSDDAIVGKDLNGIITSWNQGAERIFGYTAEEAVGQPISMLAAPETANDMPKILDQIRAGQAVEHYETIRRRKDGQRIQVSVTVSPVRDRHGRIIGASKIARDISVRKREEAERAMLLAQEQEARRIAELLNRVGPVLAVELDSEKLAQFVTEIGAALVGAEFGRFSEAMDFLEPGFRGVTRSDDVLLDERYRRFAPDYGLAGHGSPVRSHLAAPVVSRSGEVLGRLFFGHSQPAKFTENHEKILEGIAAQAAIAMDNARLLEQAQWVQNELKRSNEELRRANQDLETFAYSASHDLREPLRTVALSTQLLERIGGNALPEEARKFLGSILEGARRMENLLQNLLDYTTVTKGAEGPPPSIDPSAVLNDVLENLKSRIEQVGATVTSDLPSTVAIHEGRLAQLLQNLVGNALKYRGEQAPRIHISGVERDGWVVFSVADNGIGIESEYADQIFGLFKRLHSREEYPGSGMGLAICKRIVERYGGRIWLDKSVPGEGSTFCFSIPARAGALEKRAETC